MPGDTTATATATATAPLQKMADSSSSTQPTKANSFKCSLCDSIFADCGEQRAHFKTEWHIKNLHRKLDGETPLTETQFQEILNRASTKQKVREHVWDEEAPIKRYIVSKKSRKAELTSSANESSQEGQAPEDDLVSESESDEDDEDDIESETSDALDGEDQATASGAITWKDGNEMKLSSGKVIGTKSHLRASKKYIHTTVPITSDPEAAGSSSQPQDQDQTQLLANIASTSSSLPLSSKDRSISKRDNMGIVGLSDPQKKALLVTERKMVSLATRSKGGWEASVEAKGNCQKHYRIGGDRGGKKMGGLEKRLG